MWQLAGALQWAFHEWGKPYLKRNDRGRGVLTKGNIIIRGGSKILGVAKLELNAAWITVSGDCSNR